MASRLARSVDSYLLAVMRSQPGQGLVRHIEPFQHPLQALVFEADELSLDHQRPCAGGDFAQEAVTVARRHCGETGRDLARCTRTPAEVVKFVNRFLQPLARQAEGFGLLFGNFQIETVHNSSALERDELRAVSLAVF
jgi:hypothetical protein